MVFGSGQPLITGTQIKSLKIAFPLIAEQEKIASFLDAIATHLTQLHRKHELLQTYKRGVMQKIFSQQIRFKQADGTPFPDWEKKRLGDIGKLTGGGTPDTNNKDYWSGDIPWVSSSDISEDSIHKLSITRFINEKAVKESATKVITAPSILLISRVGVGKLAISQQLVCTSQDFSNFTPKQNNNLVFLAYLLSTKKNKLLSISQGTSIKGFTGYDISRLSLEIPAIDEQEKIATFLTGMDCKIDATKQQIQKIEKFKQGLLQKMFV
ncbi:MAG: hypothetical protein DCF15_18875 [Phormidesmis priestleyi]|uniref:Type I restriction modification DNA specificity domain-containing protein n=1 Tax=Phormidesmis priestleyi TaxID=268141 RepID=A0A2W4WWY7_9CYAN|nr:MAG: hypothetical protein DCF15_18875 [Phormidesmis priestleyi]